MDDLVKRAIQTAESKGKTPSSVPWKMDEPWNQQVFNYSLSENRWISSDKGNGTSNSAASTDKNSSVSQLALYSWNIDFMLPFPNSRMLCALRHLQKSHIQRQEEKTASVIFFQECLQSDLETIASDTWVQQNFVITDLDTSNWQSGYYGTVTLIDRRLEIEKCFRVHFSQTRMQRDGLFVDVRLGGAKIVRLCNAHLESLALEPPYRPPQMEMIARYMRNSSEVGGAVVAGDFNAIQDFDRTLHSDNSLKDAFLELSGKEDDSDGGHTWGQQAATVQRERFGTSRMDKVFFCGDVKCFEFERFGAGVEVEEENERRSLVKLGFDKPWITDHLGVKAVFDMVDDESSSSLRGGGGGKSSL